MQRYFAIAVCFIGMVWGVAALAADAKPDADGYIRDWLMLAPVPLKEDSVASDEIGKEQIPGEATLKPNAGDKVKAGGKELAWKSVHSTTNSFDLNAILNSQNENVAGYMVAYLVCEKAETDLTLFMGSNDEGRVYLNGKAILTASDARGLELDSDKAEHLTLNAGVNVLVFKVINETNNWQGSIRFKDKSGKPFTGVTIKLAP